MPQKNGTGPLGQGTGTGKGRGPCSGNNGQVYTAGSSKSIGKGITDRAGKLFRRVRGGASGRPGGIQGKGSRKGDL